MGQVTTLGQVHAQHRVSGLKQGKIHRQVRLGARVRLHVGMLRSKELAGPVPGDVLHNVHALTSAVIPLGRIALGIFIG